MAIFISYRRADSLVLAGHIFDRLTPRFGLNNVFWDKKSIPLGADFPKVIKSAVCNCKLLLVIVDHNWTRRNSKGKSSLHSSDDFVRLELTTALANKKTLMPVLVGNAQFPKKVDLPRVLWPFLNKNSATLDIENHFDADLERIIQSINRNHGVPFMQAVEPGKQRPRKFEKLYDLVRLFCLNKLYFAEMAVRCKRLRNRTGAEVQEFHLREYSKLYAEAVALADEVRGKAAYNPDQKRRFDNLKALFDQLSGEYNPVPHDLDLVDKFYEDAIRIHPASQCP